MCQVPSLCMNSRLLMLSPINDCSIDNILLQTDPNINQSLLEFIDIVDLHLVHTLLPTPQIL